MRLTPSLGARKSTSPPYRAPATRLRLEQLEDRAVPAFGFGSVHLLNVGPQPINPDVNSPFVGSASTAAVAAGELLVGFEGAVVQTFRAQGAAAALAHAGQIVGPLGLGTADVLFDVPAAAGRSARLVTRWTLPAGTDVAATAAAVASRPGVAYAEPNGVWTIQAVSDPGFQSSPPAGWTFGTQSHLAQVGADVAWGTSTGGTTTVNGTSFTSGTHFQVVVAVVDTGVDLDHPDLNGNLVPGMNFVTTTTTGPGNPKKPPPPPPPPQDDNGHGTHVAGLIAAEVNNLADVLLGQPTLAGWGGGVVGVAPKAQIMPVKVLDSGGTGSWTNIASGIRWAADNGAQIINLSLGGGFSQTVEDAVSYAYNTKGVLVISSAGNGNAEASGSPASSVWSLSVAAVDQNNVRAGFSNYGFSVDVAAPGVSDLSTFIDVNGSQTGSFTRAYGRLSGTSMAAPVIAGVAALIRSIHPTWTASAVAAQILATAGNIDAANPAYAGKLGAGLVNAAAAVGPQVTAPFVIAVGGLGADGGTVNRLEVGSLIGVQFSHEMTVNVLAPGNYRLLDGQSQEVSGALGMASTTYTAFPGQGVQLQLANSLDDGTYTFQVLAGTGAAAYSRTFTLQTPRVTTQADVPLGSLTYQGQAADRFDPLPGAGADVDRFVLDLDAAFAQRVTVDILSAVGASVALYHANGGTPVPVSQGSLLQGGTLLIDVSATVPAVTPYTMQVTLNAGTTQGGNTAAGIAQDLSGTFVTLIPAGTADTFGPALAADRAAVTGMVGAAPVPIATLEGFDGANLNAYRVPTTGARPPATFSLTAAARHDGSKGLQVATGNDWIFRNDATTALQRGTSPTVSTWVRLQGAADGRAYFGFGASPTGTLSLVVAPNTGSLVLQRNAGYGFADLASVPQTWVADKWYRLEVDWRANGDIIGRVYDSDGTTLLNSVAGNDTTISSGGIAFRSIGGTKFFDTVQTMSVAAVQGYYKFTLDAGGSVGLALNRLGGDVAIVDLIGPNGTTVLASGTAGATNVDRGLDFPVTTAGTYYARVSGPVGAQYSLLVSRNVSFDREGNDALAAAQDLIGRQGAYGYVGGAAEDWFKVSVPAGAKAVWETRTPGDAGIGNALNPRIELYDSSGAFVIAGEVLTDGRNERLTVPSGSTYYIRVTAEGGTGEYVLIDPPVADEEPLTAATGRDRRPIDLVAADVAAWDGLLAGVAGAYHDGLAFAPARSAEPRVPASVPARPDSGRPLDLSGLRPTKGLAPTAASWDGWLDESAEDDFAIAVGW